MLIKEGRGDHMKRVEEKNRQRVKDWFEKNPNTTKKECCVALGLSFATLRKHLEDIRSE